MRGKCARRESLPGVYSRAHVSFSILFSPRRCISRCRRARSMFPPEPGTQYYDRQHGEKLYRFRGISRAPQDVQADVPAGIDSSGGNRRESLSARRWGSSSAGRAPRSQRGGRGFNPLLLHHLFFITTNIQQGIEPASGADEQPRTRATEIQPLGSPAKINRRGEMGDAREPRHDLKRWRGTSHVLPRGTRQPYPPS